MAEPKQPPPSLGDAPAPKKATKKVSRPKPSPSDVATPAAAAVASAVASSGPSAAAAQSPVPKLHLSEPKMDPGNGAMPSESKPRASKKRTSTPPTGGPEIPVSAGPPAATGPSMGATDAVAMAKQAADIEKEKQAAAARREAKRQKAKELEDAKRREELAKQAMEEAKRQEEQRQREARRQQELAALNANAEECQDEEPEERNDYDDEGFENYDDDFENDDDQSAQGKAGSKSTAAVSSKKSSVTDNNDKASALELKKIQQALQAESKELLSSSRPSSSSKALTATDQAQLNRAPTTSSSIASSIAGLKKSMDPRAKRVKEVLEVRKMEVDKFNLFQQAPLSDLEKYMTHLRRGNVRQAFVQTNDGAKADATQTKPPVALHKGMHFPDDIGLDALSSSTGNPEDEDYRSMSTVRFFKFLEHATYVCEVLSEENVLEAERDLEAESKQTRKAISSSMNWTQKQIFPSKKLDNVTLDKLLRGRDIVAMQFSRSASNLLLTCYGSQSAPANQYSRACAFKDKGIACVWDVTQPHNAPRVLKCEGLITTGCFGPSRDLFALVGTEDGSIHVWDMRLSNASNCCDMDDGLIFRSPTYSTCGIDYKTANQHTSAIVALESIHDGTSNSKSAGGAAAGGNFQFGSMDDRGIVVIWSVVEFEAGDEALFADKCVEIGGRVKLVMNTWIDTQKQYMMPKKPMRVKRQGSSDALADSKSDKKDTAAKVCPVSVGPIATVFKFFPSDPNQFVVGTHTGILYRGHRFEQPNSSGPSVTYRRDRSWNRKQMGSSSQFNSAAVVCIDFHPHHSDYFLVGYEDGCICLFSSNVAVSLCSWKEVAFGISICSIQWSTARSGVFMATFSNGHVFIWDLGQQTNAPALASAIACLKEDAPDTAEGPILTPVGFEENSDTSSFCIYPLVLSSEQTRTFRPVVAFRAGNCAPFQFSIQELCAELTVKAQNEAEHTKHCLNVIF